MLQIEKELHKVFSHRQVGSITRCHEPIVLPSTVDWIENEFLEDEDIEALPVESNGVIVGILDKETFLKAQKKLGVEIRFKDIKNFLIEKPMEINAEELVDNVFDRIVTNEAHKISSYFLVYYRNSYMGFVSMLEIVKRMNSIIALDMEKAREVQENLLQKAKSNINSIIEFSVYNRMAGRVGGDFYINHLYNNRNFQIIGCFDVSGKGFSASMGTITIGSFITSLSVHGIEDTNPISFSQKLDRYVRDLSPDGNFIAGGLVFINYEHEKCYIQNFGLPPIYIFDVSNQKKTLKVLKSSLPPFGLGALSENRPFFVKFDIKKDLRIIMFTDGLPELKDPYGLQFGDEAVTQLILKNVNLSQAEFIRLVSDTVENYRKENTFSDDITLLDIKFN